MDEKTSKEVWKRLLEKKPDLMQRGRMGAAEIAIGLAIPVAAIAGFTIYDAVQKHKSKSWVDKEEQRGGSQSELGNTR